MSTTSFLILEDPSEKHDAKAEASQSLIAGHGYGLATATPAGMDLTTVRPSATWPWCLMKVVERSGEETHGVRVLRTFKARRLAAVHHLLQIPVQERVGDVELMHRPSLGRLMMVAGLTTDKNVSRSKSWGID